MLCAIGYVLQSVQRGQGHQVLVRALHHRSSPACSQPSEQLLLALLDPFNPAKTFEVGQPNVGDHAAVWARQSAQVRDFPLVVGPHFHKGKFGVAQEWTAA